MVDHFITFDVVDSADTRAKLSHIAHEVTHLFWITLQARADEEANIAVNKTRLLNVLTTLKSSTSSRLIHVMVQTGTKHYMGPINDPVRSTQFICHEPPFHENMPRLPHPNFYYTLEDVLESYEPSLTYSVHRSSIIIGLPFRYPGTRYTWEHFCDMTDAGVLAQQHVWAAVTPKAKNQAFNCTNSDVFVWKSVWKLLSKLFDVELICGI
ncbi:3-oxo-Delta(4,5)-steroid 5-beta-reductase [Spatholobus suberectus]|nr:3-oxo-Delta(4,5)-steroid 5-beta-reductase [Spatholobus suberectus]